MSVNNPNTLANWQLGRITPMPDKIPHGWNLVKLTSVAKLESGHTPSKRKPEYWDGDIPWISLHDSEFLDVKEIYDTKQKVTKLGIENSSARLLPSGTVVFSRTATVGKATTMARAMCTSQDFANYICGKELHNHYLVYLFRFLAPEWERLMAGSTHNSIYMPVFRDLQILLPSFAEQERIAATLSGMDALISGLEQLIDKKRDIKQATMQRLLTGQQRLPGFSGEWEVKRLGDVLRVRHGKNQSAIEVSGGKFPILATGGEIGRTNTFLYDKPSVLIGRKGTIDKPFYRDKPFWTVDTLFYTEISREAVPLFIYYKFLMIDWRSYNEASGVPSLNASTIESVAIVIPSVFEQAAIATILSEMDSELALLKTRRDKACQLKQGLMQELLTGRIRLDTSSTKAITFAVPKIEWPTALMG